MQQLGHSSFHCNAVENVKFCSASQIWFGFQARSCFWFRLVSCFCLHFFLPGSSMTLCLVMEFLFHLFIFLKFVTLFQIFLLFLLFFLFLYFGSFLFLSCLILFSYFLSSSIYAFRFDLTFNIIDYREQIAGRKLYVKRRESRCEM